MSALTIGGSQTGGTSKTLASAGVDQSGRYRFVFPEHTALSGRVMTASVKAQPVSANNVGFQEATVDLAITEAVDTNGDPTPGGVFVNLKLRWSLNQPSTSVDLALDYLQGVAFAAFLEDAVKKGFITL